MKWHLRTGLYYLRQGLNKPRCIVQGVCVQSLWLVTGRCSSGLSLVGLKVVQNFLFGFPLVETLQACEQQNKFSLLISAGHNFLVNFPTSTFIFIVNLSFSEINKKMWRVAHKGNLEVWIAVAQENQLRTMKDPAVNAIAIARSRKCKQFWSISQWKPNCQMKLG